MPAMNGALYPQLLGSDWGKLSPLMRAMHVTRGPISARGTFEVHKAVGWWASCLRRFSRLPPPGRDVPTRLVITQEDGQEVWCRSFGTTRMLTKQRLHAPGVMAERVGCMEFRIRVAREHQGIRYCQVGAALRLGPFKVPLPAMLAPQVEGTEQPAASVGGAQVRIAIRAPIGGRLIAYEGVIAIDRATQ